MYTSCHWQLIFDTPIVENTQLRVISFGQIDGQTDGNTDEQTDGQTDGQTDELTDVQTDGETDVQTVNVACKWQPGHVGITFVYYFVYVHFISMKGIKTLSDAPRGHAQKYTLTDQQK